MLRLTEVAKHLCDENWPGRRDKNPLAAEAKSPPPKYFRETKELEPFARRRWRASFKKRIAESTLLLSFISFSTTTYRKPDTLQEAMEISNQAFNPRERKAS